MDVDSSNIHIVRLQNTISSFHKGAKMYVLYISELGLSNADSKPWISTCNSVQYSSVLQNILASYSFACCAFFIFVITVGEHTF